MANYKVRDIRITFTVFSIIFLIYSYRHYPSVLSYLSLIIAFILLFFLTFFPYRLIPLFERWLKITRIIGKFNTKVILLIIFGLIFIPTGIVRRLFGKDPMQRKFRAGSYWEPYELAGLKDKNRYEKQF